MMVKSYSIAGTLLVFLIFSSFFLGYVANDALEEYQQNTKVVQITQRVGPSGVINNEDIVKTSGGIKLKVDDYTIVNVDEVNSISMLPFMDDKTTMIGTSNYDFNELKLGDIIVFSADGHNIAHAVVGVHEDENGRYLTTRGYNNFMIDNVKVREENVFLKITGVLYGE